MRFMYGVHSTGMRDMFSEGKEHLGTDFFASKQAEKQAGK